MKRGTLEAKLEVHKRRRVAVISISGTIGLPYGFHAPHFLESLAHSLFHVTGSRAPIYESQIANEELITNPLSRPR